MPNERQQESMDMQIHDQPVDSAVWEAQEDQLRCTAPLEILIFS